MITVKNEFGVSIDWEAASMLMDDELCEALHMEIAPCTEQEFFDAYCKAHEEKYGNPFEPAKEKPQW